ncbi:MAG: hypothetical protein E7203_08575 [Selenomonas ruminantium]|jgi:hypothetical protein|uniref:Uncharacterized protein n=1 Tax=Selenomonas ruminantium TaxID=971 RepID=A0A927WJ82_SELRU|nr:hypothetical protein [Selenomonas ruminantium]MBE6085486.1 hypothetical protein [Selenomonas ruminantium]
MKENLRLSTLGKTWIFDFDGTLVEHNGYKCGADHWLPGAKEFLQGLPAEDYVLILTAREEAARKATEDFLKQEGIRYDDIKFQIPMGERILLNDSKPSGLKMSYSVECKRNEGLLGLNVEIDEDL